MKFLLVFVCVLVACRAEIDKDFVQKFVDKIKQVSDECTTETKASPEDLKSLLDHKIPDSHEGKCLIFCFHKHFHMQGEDGSITRDEAIAALQPVKERSLEIYDKVVKVFDACSESAVKDSDPCIYAAHFSECALRERKSLGLDELLVTQ